MNDFVQSSITKARDWRMWLNGLIGAMIGGAANAVTIMVIKPEDFNFSSGWGDLWRFAVVSAVVSAALFIKEHPIKPLSEAKPQ